MGNKVVIVLLGLLVLGIWGLLLQPLVPLAAAQGDKMTLDELSVQRINIVDDDGTVRLVIANGERFPAPVIRGKTYDASKRVLREAAGMIFFNAQGEETGGLVTATRNNTETSALVFDFNYQPTDAIAIMESESADGKQWSAGLMIADRLPHVPGEIKTSGGTTRIQLRNQDHDARLIISDVQGRPRIRLGVDREGQAALEILDGNGKVVDRLPRG